MQTVEELRGLLQELQGENAALRVSSHHGKLLVSGLDSLLSVEDGSDPFTIVFQSLRQVFDFSRASALMEEGDALRCIASEDETKLGSSWAINSLLRKVLNGRTCAIMITAEAAIGADAVTDASLVGRPALFLPIKVLDKRGVLILSRDHDAEGFHRDHVSLGDKFSLLASHALAIRSGRQSEYENQRLQELTEQLEYRAYYDELTGTANRALLQKHVEAAIADREADDAFALAFIDVDKFKHINDYFGHALGDQLLIQLSQRVINAVRETDVFGRISGDEFVLMINPLEDKAGVAEVVERVARALDAPYLIEGHEIHASVSIGISICPDHGGDYETLRRNADNAMYRAKQSTKGDPVYFSAEMGRALTARMELENRLRHAIRERRFMCALQPKIDLRTARVIGFEALVRWRDEDGSIHAPGEFVGVATELGLLDDITKIVTEKALSAFEVLDPVFGDDTSIALNVAGVQANDHEFMTQLIATLTASGFAKRIILELTEDAMVAATQFRTLIQPLLSATGVGVSIDDFGTGYSCLSTLANLQADELKIDRAFVTGVHKDQINQKILFTIEHLARAIGLKTVAEGVETREELAFLMERTSIDVAQGFYFAVPMAAEKLAELGDSIIPSEMRVLVRDRRAAPEPALVTSLLRAG